MIRLGILSSSRGTNVAAIAEAIRQQQLEASIQCVISNKADAPVLAYAEQNGFAAQFINPVGLSRDAYDASVSAALVKAGVELIVLVGYMRILSANFVNQWANKIINVHPSLLPAFAGLMDLAVHQAVIDAGAAETGCTVHYVTEEVDAGPVLIQKKCAVLSEDTPDVLKSRVQQLEKLALIESIALINQRRRLNGSLETEHF